jgi:hypothetical protein
MTTNLRITKKDISRLLQKKAENDLETEAEIEQRQQERENLWLAEINSNLELLDITKYQKHEFLSRTLEDLEKKYGKYIPGSRAAGNETMTHIDSLDPTFVPGAIKNSPGSFFLKLGALYRRNDLGIPEFMTGNMGLPRYTMVPAGSNNRSTNSSSDTTTKAFVPGDIILIMTIPNWSESKPYHKVLKLKDNSIHKLYPVPGILSFWELLQEPQFPGFEERLSESEQGQGQETQEVQASEIKPQATEIIESPAGSPKVK